MDLQLNGVSLALCKFPFGNPLPQKCVSILGGGSSIRDTKKDPPTIVEEIEPIVQKPHKKPVKPKDPIQQPVLDEPIIPIEDGPTDQLGNTPPKQESPVVNKPTEKPVEKPVIEKDTTPPVIVLSATEERHPTSTIAAHITDEESNVVIKKWAKGNQSIQYFKTNGQSLSLAEAITTVTVSENDVYTFYAQDAAGNGTIETITITNVFLDDTPPTATTHVSQMIDQKGDNIVTIGIQADDGEGIGVKSITLPNGDVLEEENATYALIQNGNFDNTQTFFVEDYYGNQTEIPVEYSVTTKFDYAYEGDGVTINGYDGEVDHLLIPGTFGIDNTQVKIINDNAFAATSDSYKINALLLPEGLEEIKENAFAGNKLTTVTIPSSIKTIGLNAFASNKLTQLTMITDKEETGVTTIGMYAFAGNVLEQIDIGNNQTHNHTIDIDMYAFVGNYGTIQTITLGSNVKEIGEGAFVGNGGIGRVVIGDPQAKGGDTVIGRIAFNSNYIGELVLGNNIVEIGEQAFGGDTTKKDIYIPQNIRLIGYLAFNDNHIGTLTIEDQDITLGNFSFSRSVIDNVHFGNGNKLIGDHAFDHATIHEINLGAGNKTIGEFAFTGIDETKVFNFGEGDLIIKDFAFNVENVEKFLFGNGDKIIGKHVFSNIKVDQLDFKNGNMQVGYFGFSGKIPKIIFGKGNKKLGDFSFYDNYTTSIDFNEGNLDIGEFAFSSNNVTTLMFKKGEKRIGNYAFYSDSYKPKGVLNMVDFNEGALVVGKYAFWNNQLTNLVLPKETISIGEAAFSMNFIINVTVLSDALDFSDEVFHYNPDPIDTIANRQQLTIEAHLGSTAAQYALENDHAFVALP